MTQPKYPLMLGSIILICLCGCQLFVDAADREVYRLIEQRQMAALGQTSDARLGRTDEAEAGSAGSPYNFVPHPVSPDIPDAFKPPEPAPAQPTETDQGGSPDQEQADSDVYGDTDDVDESPPDEEMIEDSEQFSFGSPFTLQEGLAYAIQHAREYQDAREDLYLQALALTLERYLWTPRFMSDLQATYTEFPQGSDPDRALEATADLAVEQRLPFGGEVIAQWIGTMVRDLENHVTSAESGTAIIQANIPLLRGGGRVAYESRYQAERDLIYAVRRYERFRRVFLTRVASEYFRLLSTKSRISNAVASRKSALDNWERTQALARAERRERLDADRAMVDFLQAKNRVINAVEEYESALDEFKILIGMSTIEEIDVVDEELDLPEPQVQQEAAIATALESRLDLLTVLDRVDDVKRGIEIAKNNLLPDLDISGSVSYTSNPDHFSSTHFREDDETWTLGVGLEIPLDRKAERNLYRSSLIDLRRARRDHGLAADRVRLEVRRALRQIRQAISSLQIQLENKRINEVRREVAQLKFEDGTFSNRDVVEAINDLRQASDDYDQAKSALRQTILQFRLATGTLRVSDDGQWID